MFNGRHPHTYLPVQITSWPIHTLLHLHLGSRRLGAMAADEDTATVVSGIVTGLAALCVALRFFVRVRTKVGVSWDDCWILIGLLLTLATGGLIIWGK